MTEMSNQMHLSARTGIEGLLNALQSEAANGGVQPETVCRLREAVTQVEHECGEFAQREQAARAEAEAARAEAAATRAEADRAIKALAESEQRYRYMGETIPFGVWWCNPRGEAEYTSASFLELLNMSMEEMQQFGWTQRLVPEDVEPMMTKWLNCIRTGTPWDHEHRIIDRHGKINTILSRGLPVRDEAGQVIAWVGVNLDITDRKRIELELKQAKEAMEEAMKAKDQFLANISHELRTPLTLILGPLRKMLPAGNLTEDQRHDLKVMERNARTLLKNVNDLLDLSRLDAGRLRAEYAQVDAAQLARFVASHFESVAADKQIDFAVAAPDSLPAQLDSDKLQRILFNLLSNAFKFTPSRGSIRLGLHAEEGRAVFEVQDTGPGVPPQMRQAIFERFRQVEGGATRRYGGTGLGLAIAREFVTLHGGSVRVEPVPAGTGAKFVVELPLSAPQGAQVTAAAPAMDEQVAQGTIADLRIETPPSLRGRSAVPPDAPLVLVVEDNPEMNTFIAESMADHYRVATAFDGQEGLEKTSRLRPDLVISDLMMPRLSGEQMVREVRRRRELDAVPILLVTAKADERLRVELLSSGAQDCLVKPFVAEELVARASGLIARKQEAEAALRQSEQRYRTLFESIDEGFCIIQMIFDENGKPIDYRFLETNPSFERQSGLIHAPGRRMRELAPEHEELWFEIYGRVSLTGQPVRFQNRAEQLQRWFDVYAFRVGPAAERQVAVLFSDITERKRAEEALRQALAQAEERERILTAMMEHIPMGITIADAPEVNIRAVSRYGRELTGKPRQQIEGIPVDLHAERWQIYHADGVTPAANQDLPLTRATQKGELVVGEEWVLRRGDGTRIPILCTAAPIRDADGHITGGVIGWQDLREQKRAQEAIRQLNAELEQRVEQRTAELAAANRELEAFSYTVSHDLRAPLRHVTGFVELLGEHAGPSLDEEGQEYLRTIAQSAERMGQLIDDLLTLSRLGRATIAYTAVDLRQLVDEARAELAPQTAGRAIEWQIGPLPQVRGDRTLLRNVMVNLLSNAIKYSRNRIEARIEVGAREQDGEVVCFVKDNGAGFDMKFADKLFGVFQRLHPAQKFEGTGIGLASVRRIIERHGGRVWAQGAVDQGASFYFALPAPRRSGS